MPVGSKVLFSLRLMKFADTFQAEGTVVRASNLDGKAWSAGIKFGHVDTPRLKRLNYMASWFTSFRHSA